ncbi:MAG: outer membrane beta-barrel protein [Bryobacteraceae bacterium]
MRFIVGCFLLPAVAAAQANWFGGGFAGVSTLSADATAETVSGAGRLAQYKPENGLTAMGFFGRHVNDYFSVQATYGWNANDVGLLSASVGGSGQLSERSYRARMNTVLGEGMLYFRNRRSSVRPYLSAGAGVSHLRAEGRDRLTSIGSTPAFPDTFSSSGVAFRAAVGIDLRMTGGLAFRYSFAETIQANGLSRQLTPRGKRNLANFQNLFGLIWEF